MGDELASIAEAYDRRFQRGDLRESDAHYRWVLEKLGPAAGGRLLDVACGEGLLLREALARGLETYGVDLSRQALERSRALAPGAQLALANGERLPYDDASFDYVTCLGSLEHYLDPWRGAAEIRRVLKPDGRAAIFVPNSYYLADIVWHVWRQGRPPDHHQVIQRFATRQEWTDYLAMMGLKVFKTHPYNYCWPRTRVDWAWYRRNPRRLLYLLSGLVTPRNLSYSFLFLCAPGEPRPELNAGLHLGLHKPSEP
jgi:ubiquinone/menaquinone biosynthesis C-methylase UbiE